MSSFRAILTGALVLLFIVSAADAREWTDKKGKKLEAEFVSLKNGKTYLEKKDGSIIGVELTSLSDEDIEFLQSLDENQDYFSKHPISSKSENAADTEPQKEAKPTAENNGAKTASKNPSRKMAVIHVDNPTKVGEVRQFPDMGWGVKSLAFSPDGKFLAVGKMDNAIMLFDADKSTRVAFLDKLEGLDQVTAICFSPNGKQLLAGGYRGRIQVWNIDDEGTLSEAARFVGHQSEVLSIRVSDDGKNVLSGGKNVCYWELETGRELFSFDGFKAVKACHITKSKKQGLATDGNILALIDLKEGKIIEKMTLNPPGDQTAAISPNGKLLALNDGYNLHIFDIVSGKAHPPLKNNGIQWFATFTPNSKFLLSGDQGKVNLWDLDKSRKIYEFDTAGPTYIQMIAASPDRWHFAAIPSSAGQKLQIFRLPSEVAKP